MIPERLVGYIEQSIKKNWDIEALSNYREKGYTYKELAEKILKLHLLFRDSEIKEGDKIALVGRNSANWCVTYLATVTYGAVTVPILPDFKPDDLTNIIVHSDSKMLFVDDKIYESLDITKMPDIAGVFSLDDFRLIRAVKLTIKDLFAELEEKFKKAFPEVKPEHVKFS